MALPRTYRWPRMMDMGMIGKAFKSVSRALTNKTKLTAAKAAATTTRTAKIAARAGDDAAKAAAKAAHTQSTNAVKDVIKAGRTKAKVAIGAGTVGVLGAGAYGVKKATGGGQRPEPY